MEGYRVHLKYGICCVKEIQEDYVQLTVLDDPGLSIKVPVEKLDERTRPVYTVSELSEVFHQLQIQDVPWQRSALERKSRREQWLRSDAMASKISLLIDLFQGFGFYTEKNKKVPVSDLKLFEHVADPLILEISFVMHLDHAGAKQKLEEVLHSRSINQ